MTFLYPNLEGTPVLYVLGFAPLGPVAHSIASTVQSYTHPIIQRSFFSILQSARMGGYGVEIVDNTIRSGLGTLTGWSWYTRNLIQAKNALNIEMKTDKSFISKLLKTKQTVNLPKSKLQDDEGKSSIQMLSFDSYSSHW
ncbi:uncharacterized protein L201_006236 [Kwoniella dendrophila CBS 6074]|uniref:Uncharacterized protein n=1 Tax=Kwoniella dendrophila CBS 6074 TaxID=1295534 RepID=A0AAX4K2G6_9TREE